MQVGWVSSVQDRRVASFRYRVEAPAAGLRARGHQVEVLDPAKADSYDVVVFSKAYSREHLAFARTVKKRGARVIFDICDNHFYNPYDLPKYRRAREEIGEMMAIADRVICSTPTLASVVRDEIDGAFEPIVIGDVVERFKPRRRAVSADRPLQLTWFGSHGSPNAPSGMTDLLLIREELEALAARRAVELTVCSNSRDKFDQTIAPMGLPTRYVEWSLEGFPKMLADADAAILPMNINPFTACKTHNRLTTALYAGVPVIASGIDSYQEFGAFCTLDDWGGGFQAVVDGHDEERQRALASRAHIDQRWTIEALASQWEAALALSPKGMGEGGRLHGVRLHGRLDAVAFGAVTGWVRAPVQPNLQLQVVLECDGEPVSIAIADRPRPDLRGAGLASDCGFSLPLPPRIAAGIEPSRLAVRVLDTDWIVGEDPILAASEGAISTSRSAGLPLNGAEEQRWDVSGSVSAQERMLLEVRDQVTERTKARTTAAKAVFGDVKGRNGGELRTSGSTFKDLIRSGADTTAWS